MIVFDLTCPEEHVFEAWFKDSKTFERQRKKGQVACPVCADTQVEKALMAPNISTSGKRGVRPGEKTAAATQAMQVLSQMRAHVEQNCDYVGKEFAEEARKIHFGETEKRDIYGEATRTEAESLKEDGVEFGEIPWVPRMDN